MSGNGELIDRELEAQEGFIDAQNEIQEGYSGCVLGHFRGRYDDGPPPWGIMGVEENPP